jgi:dipeptidyl-peptidase-4
VWHIADPAHPEIPAVEHRYPAAGATNAEVSLHVIAVADAHCVDIHLGGTWEYLNSVAWNAAGFIAQTQTRDQRHIDVHLVDPVSGTSSILYSDEDDAWVELVPGVPALLHDGRLVTCADRDGVRRLVVDNRSATPDHLQVRSVISTGETIMFAANDTSTPWIQDIYSFDTHSGALSQFTNSNGMVSASGTSHVLVTRTSTVDTVGPQFAVHHNDAQLTVSCHAEKPLVEPNARIMSVGPRGIRR